MVEVRRDYGEMVKRMVWLGIDCSRGTQRFWHGRERICWSWGISKLYVRRKYGEGRKRVW